MQAITNVDLETVRGGADEGAPASGGAWDSIKGAANDTWQGVKDFSGGFASGYLGRGRDGQMWGDSSSRASKAGGELGEFASSGFGPGRLPKPRR